MEYPTLTVHWLHVRQSQELYEAIAYARQTPGASVVVLHQDTTTIVECAGDAPFFHRLFFGSNTPPTTDWISTAADRDLWHKLTGSVRPKVEKRGRRPAQAQPLQLPPPAPAKTSLPLPLSTAPFLASSTPPRQRRPPTLLIPQI